ncbi:polysulfide reductase NrfD [Amycolatopsis sp. K13G38]|uniref:Polysulfide reductase NrfD n=2 Tax=Amycolatopsis acididurans TaxID=2724524 RepID=A0ABX1J1R2_9PSEU|nr:polysulfide reductase NrfD [Amycolatopsis acididurans]
MDGPDGPRRWLKVLDQTKCIGCHACTTACKSENDVPLSVTRTFVKSVDVGRFPEARRAFQVTRCNQCADAPCVAACPTAAMHTRPDGIVDFDKDLCIGCKACMAACPYDAIFINPDDHAAEKCNMCAHRLDIGLEPACVTVCPTQAIIVGDAEDPESEAARIVARQPVSVRRPEKGTRPQVFYRGATQSTLDPLGADRPAGDTYAWSEIPRQPGEYASGHPGASNSSAAALLSYDVAHGVPWDWRVALYTWTKSIAAGAYLTALLLALLGRLSWTGVVFGWVVPVLAAVALAATVVILIWDLEHPERFYYVLTKPQWRSWLVRGGVIITLYAAVLAVHLLGSLLGSAGLRQAVAVAGGPVAVATAVYTAYLFAQATARDMWQNPLLPPHLLVQAMVAGAAALLPIAAWWTGGPVVALAWVLAVAAAVHVLLVFGEITLAHPSAHARLAMHEMLTGRWRAYFWAGLPLVAVGVAAPLAGAWVAIPALLGLLAHEHAYVQAGQSVPLA